MQSQQINKTVVDITEFTTIVYANDDIDTLITINANGLQWWFKDENGKYDLVDTFFCRIDLSTATLAEARQLGENWFLSSLGADIDEPTTVAVSVATRSPIVYKREELKRVVPGYRQVKDAHTEHCCIEHKCCFYNSSRCSVVLGKKKPSYPCRCKHD